MKALATIFLIVSLLSFGGKTQDRQYILNGNEEIEKILLEFTDSLKIKKALGNDYTFESGSRHLNTVSGGSSTFWYSFDYKNQGTKIVIYYSPKKNKNKRAAIILNSRAEWKVNGITCGKSKFEETWKEAGRWCELGDIEGDHNLNQFGYVTKFVQFRSQQMADTDSLDYENIKQMETLFKSENVYNIILGDNSGLLRY